MWLSRIRVKREAGLKALGPVLLPKEDDKRIGLGHRMMWSLFPDHVTQEGQNRLFLWREEARGNFIVLSREQPQQNELLEVTESESFAPSLAADDKVLFRLRANPTVDRKQPNGKRKRCDVVMDAIHALPKGRRAEPRNLELGWGEDDQGRSLPLKAPRDWLDRQGESNGFKIEEAIAPSYQALRVPRNTRRGNARDAMTFGLVEFDGVLTVTDPEQFSRALLKGFGRAKAFGCGLMLIRKA